MYLMRHAVITSPNRSNPDRGFSVTFRKDDSFVGREGIVSDVNGKIPESSINPRDSHKGAALVLTGGCRVGCAVSVMPVLKADLDLTRNRKSQIAVEYYTYRVKGAGVDNFSIPDTRR